MLLQKLTSLHQRRRLDVAGLSERIGKSCTTVYRYLSGEVDPPYSVVVQMAEAAPEFTSRRPTKKGRPKAAKNNPDARLISNCREASPAGGAAQDRPHAPAPVELTVERDEQ